MYLRIIKNSLLNRSSNYKFLNKLNKLNINLNKRNFSLNQHSIKLNSINYQIRNLSITNHLFKEKIDQIEDNLLNNTSIDSQTDFLSNSDKEIIDLNLINNQSSELIDNLIQTTLQNPTAIDIGLSQYLPPRLFYDLLMKIHDTTNLTWITTIALSCLTLRILTFKLYLNSKRDSILFIENTHRMQKSLVKFENDHTKHADAFKDAQEFKSNLTRLFMSPFANAIVFSSFFFCLRAMANHPIQSLKDESFLWIPSLSQADPYAIFPFLTSFTMFLMLRYNMENIPKTNATSYAKHFNYLLPGIVFLVTCMMPSNLTFYWFINNNITVFAYFLLKQPKIKEYFNIPELKEKPPTEEESLQFTESYKKRIGTMIKLQDIIDNNELNKRIKEENEKNLNKRIDDLERKMADYKKFIENQNLKKKD